MLVEYEDNKGQRSVGKIRSQCWEGPHSVASTVCLGLRCESRIGTAMPRVRGRVKSTPHTLADRNSTESPDRAII